jgi:hypothetical protein
MARAGEGEFDAVMDQALAVRALAGAHFIEQTHTVPSSRSPARMRPST